MTESSPEDRKKLIHRIGGLLGWFLVNGLIWLILSEGAYELGILLFFANLVVLLFLILNRPTRWIGQGILMAWAVNFVLALLVGSFFNGLCLIPFYDPIL